MGSVKDLVIIEEPTETELGMGYFNFSDRYSVFDWGEMPDHVPLKGAALAVMGAASFELLEAAGIETHYLGLVEDGEIRRLGDLSGPSSTMAVKLTRVIHPNKLGKGYDYSFFKDNRGKIDNYLVPLECIYRNALPLGSSMFGKLKDGRVSLAELGLTEQPNPGDWLPEPKYDFSTKLEESGDRFVKGDEPFEISGLTREQFNDLGQKIRQANQIITDRCSAIGLDNYDGKFEFMVYDGNIVFVDVLGTPDESRFALGKLQVSKEVIRQWYKKNNSGWAYVVPFAKKVFKDEWKANMIELGFEPVNLPEGFLKLVSDMYPACANAYSGLDLFDVRPLPEIMVDLEKTDCAIRVTG